MKKTNFVRVCITIVIVIMMALSIVGCGGSTTTESSDTSTSTNKYSDEIERVRNSTYAIDSDVTFGEAFDAFFGNYTWEIIPTDEFGHFCRFTGYCSKDGNTVKCEIEFIDYVNGYIVADTLKINGVEEQYIVLTELLDAVFADYEETYPSSNTANESTSETTTSNNHESENEYYYPDLTDYLMTDYNDFRYYDSIDEFIKYYYAGIIYDYEMEGYDAVDGDGYDSYAIDITFYMSDEYGWTDDDYLMIAYDVREALHYYCDFYNFGYINFCSPNGDHKFYYDNDDIF